MVQKKIGLDLGQGMFWVAKNFLVPPCHAKNFLQL
jgi:hypothetical protein